MGLTKRYLKIISVWLGVCSFIGLIIAFAGAGPGGVSAIFLFLAIGFGFVGGAIHTSIVVFLRGTTVQKIIIPFGFITIVALVYLNISNGLINGYHYIQERADHIHLLRNEVIVVKPTIVSLDIVSKYIVGLRLEVDDLSCDNGAGYQLRVVNKRYFFIVNTDNHDIVEFVSREKFKNKLSSLELLDKVELNYSRFDEIWSRYSKYYKNISFNNCVRM